MDENGRDDTPGARHVVVADDLRPRYGLAFVLYTDRQRALLYRMLCLVDDDEDAENLEWLVKRARATRGRTADHVMRQRAWDSWAARLAAVAGMILALIGAFTQIRDMVGR